MATSLPVAALSLAAVTALGACASGGGGRGGPGALGGGGPRTVLIAPEALVFIGFDANRDLKVTRAEFDAGVSAAWTAFAKTETGGVRVLTLQEWLTSQIGSNSLPIALLNFDPDQDGVASEADFAKEMERRFQRRDRDGDTIVTRAEFVEQAGAVRQLPDAPDMRGGERPDQREGGPPRRR